mgnify:CR=1 FL=1
MADSEKPAVEATRIPGARVQLQTEESSIAIVDGASTEKIIRAISETIFIYGQTKHEYTPIKIEVVDSVQKGVLTCNLTLISEQNKQTILQLNAECERRDEAAVVSFVDVQEVQSDDESETTWFLNLCKQFELLGPWIEFPRELFGEVDTAESETSSESEK